MKIHNDLILMPKNSIVINRDKEVSREPGPTAYPGSPAWAGWAARGPGGRGGPPAAATGSTAPPSPTPGTRLSQG